MKDSNFKNLDIFKKKENKSDSSKKNNYDSSRKNNYDFSKKNNYDSSKKNNKFVNKRETEEEQLEREYQRRKFREAVLAYDWSKRAPVEVKKKNKEHYISKQETTTKSEYKTLSNALKSNISSRKDRLDLLKKRILFLKQNNILNRIKDKKTLDFYLSKKNKLNFSINFIFSRIMLLNFNKLFKKKKKKKNSFFSFFKRLSIDSLIKFKEKINSIDNNLIIQNINLFYYREIFSYFSSSILANKVLGRKMLNSLFLYLNKKFKKKIINKYNSILFNLEIKKKERILDQLFVFQNFITYDLLKIYPLSFFIENNSLYEKTYFRKCWKNFYLNKPLLKVFFKKKISKKKIVKFTLRKRVKRKQFSNYIFSKFTYFKKKFILLNSKLSFKKKEDNREMTPAESNKQSYLKNSLKNSVNKKEILSDIFKLNYPHLSKTKINKLLNFHLKTEANLIKQFKKRRKIKFKKFFLKLNIFKKKLSFLNRKFKYSAINKTERILNKQYALKFKKTSDYFGFFKRKSKYFLYLDYMFHKKYLEKKGIKFNVYGYKVIKVNKYNIKESLPKLRFKYKKNKFLFLNYIKKKKNYKYLISQYIRYFFKKYRAIMLRHSKKTRIIFLNLIRKFKKKKYLYIFNFLRKKLSIKTKKLYYLNKKKYYSFKNRKFLSIFGNKLNFKYKDVSSFNSFYLCKLKNSYDKIVFNNSISLNFKNKNTNFLNNSDKIHNKDYLYSIRKKIFHLKKLTKRMLRNKNSNKSFNLNIKFINIFLSKYSSENLITNTTGKKQTEKYLFLLRKYDKFKNKRNYLNKLKKKKIRLSLSALELSNKNYLNNINNYIVANKNATINLDLFIKKCRYNNIFIQPIIYHSKLFVGELSGYKNKDYIDAYWNINSLYFKFIGFLIREGKRNKAEKILNNSFFFIKEFVFGNPVFFFFQSIYNSQPIFEYIKHKKRYKTITIPRITPYNKRLTLSMRSISNNIRNNEILRKFRKIKFKNYLNTSYLLYNLFVSHFFVKGKIKKSLKENLENAFSKKHFFRKGNLSKKNFKYNKLLKFMSFRKIKGYQF